MVKCADCGFLAQRHVETRELRDAEGHYRKTGDIPRFHAHGQVTSYLPGEQYEVVPICTERQIDFAEISGQTIEQAIQEERDCPQSRDWIPGVYPKELREMVDREKLLEWQAKEGKAQRDWQSEERTRDNKWRALEMFLIAAGVVAAITIAVYGSGSGGSTNSYLAPSPVATTILQPTP
jgi:hypothetical protein